MGMYSYDYMTLENLGVMPGTRDGPPINFFQIGNEDVVDLYLDITGNKPNQMLGITIPSEYDFRQVLEVLRYIAAEEGVGDKTPIIVEPEDLHSNSKEYPLGTDIETILTGIGEDVKYAEMDLQNGRQFFWNARILTPDSEPHLYIEKPGNELPKYLNEVLERLGVSNPQRLEHALIQFESMVNSL